LARAALRHADPATETVAGTARRYGFLEPGRFAVVYRTLFGEAPSVTRKAFPIESSRATADDTVSAAPQGPLGRSTTRQPSEASKARSAMHPSKLVLR